MFVVVFPLLVDGVQGSGGPQVRGPPPVEVALLLWVGIRLRLRGIYRGLRRSRIGGGGGMSEGRGSAGGLDPGAGLEAEDVEEEIPGGRPAAELGIGSGLLKEPPPPPAVEEVDELGG